MVEVDARHVHVFHVPGEDSPITSYVEIRLGDAVEFSLSQAILQNRIQFGKIPGIVGVPLEKSSGDVGSIKQGLVEETGPEVCFYLVELQVFYLPLTRNHGISVFLDHSALPGHELHLVNVF